MTPAIVELEEANHSFRILEYRADPTGEGYGIDAAAALGVPAAAVFKTLVAELAGGELVTCIVPVDRQLELKELARAAGTKRAILADSVTVERRTGYVVGGISPFGQRRRLRTFIDRSAEGFEEIFVSGGRRGLEIALAPRILIDVLDAAVVDLT